MKNLFFSLSFILLVSVSALAQLAGERLVPSDDYPDLKTVADSLNLYGVGSGGINFMLQGGSSFEEVPLEFIATGTIADPVYIGWDGQGEKPTVNFNGSQLEEEELDGEAGFTLSGVDYYTIDGIKISNSNSNIEIGILLVNADTLNGAHYNTVQNVEIILDKLNGFQTVGISVDARYTPVALEGNNNNNKFYNNSISNVMIGYTFDGSTSDTFLMSVGNEVGTQGDGESLIFDIVMAGVTARDQNGFNFSNNTIRDLTRIGDGNTAPAAIATSSGNPSDPMTNAFIISNNTIEDMTSSFTSIYGMYISSRKATYHINNNKIHNITATGGDGNTADGMMVLATDAEANIYNNMVSGIEAPASALNGNGATRGINVRTYGQANVFYNTVVLDYTATNPAHHSAAFIIYNNSAPVQMSNNIFINKTVLPEDATGVVAAVYKRNNTFAGIMTESDNNIYYAGEPGPQNAIYYGHNSSTPNLLETLEDYKIAAGTFDQNSYTEDVPFVAANDLHVLASANTVARNNALPITDPISITTDFDGSIRDTETPDIGADEIASPAPVLAINPNPEDGATDVSVELPELSWEYLTTPEFTLPEAFLVYLNDAPSFEGMTPFATVMWEEGTTNYSAQITQLFSNTDYYWKVVPTTAIINGDTPEDVNVWTFKTEMAIFPYPIPAVNPSPADGATIELTEDPTISFGWNHYPSPTHSLPAYFELYGATDTNNVAWQTPMISFSANEGQTTYSLGLSGLPNFTYELLVDNFWKIVPVSGSGEAAPNVPVWTFKFDETIGLNDVSLEGTLIYPNPAHDFVNIEPSFDGKYEILLYDVQGKLIKHFGEITGKATINVAAIQAGAYQMVIKQDEARFTSLIKVK